MTTGAAFRAAPAPPWHWARPDLDLRPRVNVKAEMPGRSDPAAQSVREARHVSSPRLGCFAPPHKGTPRPSDRENHGSSHLVSETGVYRRLSLGRLLMPSLLVVAAKSRRRKPRLCATGLEFGTFSGHGFDDRHHREPVGGSIPRSLVDSLSPVLGPGCEGIVKRVDQSRVRGVDRCRKAEPASRL
jgi:hypothetical protein